MDYIVTHAYWVLVLVAVIGLVFGRPDQQSRWNFYFDYCIEGILVTGFFYFPAVVSMVTSACFGYLSYSDRPGPGFYAQSGMAWDALKQGIGMATFGMTFTWPMGLAVVGTARLCEKMSGPFFIRGIVTGLVAGFTAALSVAGVGWYVALDELPADIAAIVLVPVGIFLATGRLRQIIALYRKRFAWAIFLAITFGIVGPVAWEIVGTKIFGRTVKLEIYSSNDPKISKYAACRPSFSGETQELPASLGCWDSSLSKLIYDSEDGSSGTKKIIVRLWLEKPVLSRSELDLPDEDSSFVQTGDSIHLCGTHSKMTKQKIILIPQKGQREGDLMVYVTNWDGSMSGSPLSVCQPKI